MRHEPYVLLRLMNYNASGIAYSQQMNDPCFQISIQISVQISDLIVDLITDQIANQIIDLDADLDAI